MVKISRDKNTKIIRFDPYCLNITGDNTKAILDLKIILIDNQTDAILMLCCKEPKQ